MLKRRKIPIRMRRTRKTVMNPRTMMMRRPAMQKVIMEAYIPNIFY